MLIQKLKIQTVNLQDKGSPWSSYKARSIFFYLTRIIIWFPRIITVLLIYFLSFLVSFFTVILKLHKVQVVKKVVIWILYINFRAFLFVIGIVKITKNRSPTKNKNIKCVVANHVSIFDPVLAFCIGSFSFISKIEVKKNFIQKYIGEFFNTIYLERTERNVETINNTLRHANKEPPLLLYPEGSTNRGHCILNFGHGGIFDNISLEVLSVKYSCFHLIFNCNNCSLEGFTRLTTKNILSVIEMLSYLSLYKITITSNYIPKERENKLDIAKQIFKRNLKLDISNYSRFDILVNMAASINNETDTLFINDEYVCFDEFRRINDMLEDRHTPGVCLKIEYILSLIKIFKEILKNSDRNYLIDIDHIFSMFEIKNKICEDEFLSRMNYITYKNIEINDIITSHEKESGVSLLNFITCGILKRFTKR